MKIHLNDLKEIHDFIVSEQKDGKVLAAYPVESPILSKSDIPTFHDPYDAWEYCFENSTDIDRYSYTDIGKVCDILGEALRDKSLLIEQDTIVDLDLMEFIRQSKIPEQNLEQEQKLKIMDGQNVRDNVKDMEDVIVYGGFSEIISSRELHEKMESGVPEFKLEGHISYPDGKGGENKVDAALNFALSERGNYYSPSFDLKLTKADETLIEQQFKNNYGDKYTLKEGYNMMDGRSVTKDFLPIPKKDKETGERLPRERNEDGTLKTYRATAYLDLTEKQDNNFKITKVFGLDINKMLSEYPFKEKDFAQSYADLVDSLQRGNRQAVTVPSIEGPDKPDVRMHVEVNGRFRNLSTFDSNMNPDRFFLSNWKQYQEKTHSQQLQENGPGQSQGHPENGEQQKKNQKQGKAEGEAVSQELKEGRRRGPKVG